MRLDGDSNVTIRIRELKEKPGKEIILVFGEYEILLDNRCLGNTDEEKHCSKCKLKFRCFTSDAIRINFNDDLLKMPLPSERPTLGEIVQWYFASKGVDQSLTKIAAYDTIEEGEKGGKRSRAKDSKSKTNDRQGKG